MVGLAGSALMPARTLPHGDQRKLELGMILAPDPELLLLDEPTAGMASEQVPELMAMIQAIQEAGEKTVMLVEHNMNVVMSVSDRITVMHQGMVLAEGTPAEISNDAAVQNAYLGGLYEPVGEGCTGHSHVYRPVPHPGRGHRGGPSGGHYGVARPEWRR